MGKAEKERLNKTLTTYMSNIHETLQILDQTPSSSSLKKVNWADVIQMGEQLSKQATTAGLLFSEEGTDVKGLEENMAAYFNVLQGLVLLAYGSTVGAGWTLTSNIHSSLKEAVDCSFMLWTECVSSYGSRTKELKLNIPQRVGTVWEACSALKKTPASNIVAIGRAITQVAVSMKDVLREMKELEPCSSEPAECSNMEEATSGDDDEDDFGKDLSLEEMKIANLAIQVVSEAVIVIKELIRSITSLLKRENSDEKDSVESLEKLLKLSRQVGTQVDELGACLYPPQELSAIAKACEKMSNMTDEMVKILESFNVSTEAFFKGCKALENALEMIRNEVSDSYVRDSAPQDSSVLDVAATIKNLSVQD